MQQVVAILDFKEIPEAHTASGEQDTFELLAEEVLRLQGFEILRGPSRGADGGKDLIVREVRRGALHSTTINYLVSSKHKAHSGKSVGTDDEVNIDDRVKANGCQGFIGFYSTIASTSLETKVKALGFESHFFSYKSIEKTLLESEGALRIARRYFPASVAKYNQNHPVKTDLFSQDHVLACEICGLDLLAKPFSSSFTAE